MSFSFFCFHLAYVLLINASALLVETQTTQAWERESFVCVWGVWLFAFAYRSKALGARLSRVRAWQAEPFDPDCKLTLNSSENLIILRLMQGFYNKWDSNREGKKRYETPPRFADTNEHILSLKSNFNINVCVLIHLITQRTCSA